MTSACFRSKNLSPNTTGQFTFPSQDSYTATTGKEKIGTDIFDFFLNSDDVNCPRGKNVCTVFLSSTLPSSRTFNDGVTAYYLGNT